MLSRTSLALVIGGSLVLVAAPSFASSLALAGWSLNDNDIASAASSWRARFSDPNVSIVGNRALSVVSRDAPARSTLADATSAARNFGADALIANAWAKDRVSALAAGAGTRTGDQFAAERAAAARALVNTAFSADRASLNADVRAVEHLVLAQTDTGYAEAVVIRSEDRPAEGGGPDRDNVSPVPEPASALVFGLGALAVGAFLIKRRRAGALGNTTQI